MNVKNKNIFVNRRGHKRAVDMSDEMEALEAHKTIDKSKKPTKKTVKKPLKRWQKITIVVLIALLVCG
ncbi:hypothetical protein EOL73_05070, partial [Candidatus Saccharibacteria bacterium]|nr:hypothetical protein [Candidatus Saccharibacteria bacterium]